MRTGAQTGGKDHEDLSSFFDLTLPPRHQRHELFGRHLEAFRVGGGVVWLGGGRPSDMIRIELVGMSQKRFCDII